MKLSQPDIHGDLKAALDRSLELKAVLERMVADPHPEGNSRALNRLSYMQRKIRNVKVSLGYNEPFDTSAKAKATTDTARVAQTASPKCRRRDGKKKLFKSLRDGNLRILATRAGRKIEGINDPSETQILRVLNDMHLDSTELSTERSIDSNTSKLPFVSLTSGKTEEPITLPTFDEYANITFQLGLSSPVEKALKSVKRTMEHITSFKKKMENMQQLFRVHNTPANYSRRNAIRRMTMPPAKLASIIISVTSDPNVSSSHHKTTDHVEHAKGGATNRSSETPKSSRLKPQVPQFVTSPRGVSTPRSRNLSCGEPHFDVTIDSEEKKLSKIVESITEERPTTIRRKQRLMSYDIEQLLATANAEKLLDDIRVTAENERQAKRMLNKKQADMYRRLLEKIFNRKVTPNATEVAVVEAIRRVIESGEIIDGDSIEMIRRALKGNASQADEMFKLIEYLADAYGQP
mmetsp:Transcript_26389/g.47385  ORF Transcript_26389/g.47385 Transcript_26389/m.47385 type:complete len:463 (+) Transcript_26389:2243-3631(+)